MDLIISSCTSTAHLAAASGTKTWVLVPAACYYIWAHQGNRSPWYSNVTLFRQTEVGQWQTPFLNIQNELLKLLIQENITSNLAQ